jgi:hypothetical protein
LASEASGVGRGPEIPVVSNTKTTPAHAALLAKNIPSPFCTLAIEHKALSPERSCAFGESPLGQALANCLPSGRRELRILADEHDRQRYYILCLGEGPSREKIGRLVRRAKLLS